MALSREKKTDVVAETSQLLADSKLTVVAKYQGTSVKALQDLRREARDNGTVVRIIKNRLFKLALAGDERFKDIETAPLTGQLLYAFGKEDETAPAQSLANFAKAEPQIEFLGGFSAEGEFLPADDIKALAALPSKDQLRAMLVGTIGAPLSGFVGVLSGLERGLLNVLNARSEAIKE